MARTRNLPPKMPPKVHIPPSMLNDAMNAVFPEGVEITATNRQGRGYLFDVNDPTATVEHNKRAKFVVYTTRDRDHALKSYIEDSIELYTPEFLQKHLRVELPMEAILAIQNCPTANAVFKDLVKDMDEFIADSVNEDGRGHFLAPYDHKEHYTVFNDVIFWYYRVD